MVLTHDDIVKYKYGSSRQNAEPPPREKWSTMNVSIELAKVVQQEREAHIQSDQLARLAARVRECCDPTMFNLLVRALYGSRTGI